MAGRTATNNIGSRLTPEARRAAAAARVDAQRADVDGTAADYTAAKAAREVAKVHAVHAAAIIAGGTS